MIVFLISELNQNRTNDLWGLINIINKRKLSTLLCEIVLASGIEWYIMLVKWEEVGNNIEKNVNRRIHT